MKRFALCLIALVMIFSAVPFMGCQCGGPGEVEEGAGLTKLEAMTKIADFSISAELATYELLEIFSEGYTEPLFGENVEISTEDYNAIFEIMEDIDVTEEELTQAWDILTVKPVASTPTSFLAPRVAYASPGLFGAVLDFYEWAKGGGKRSRDRTLKAAELALQQAHNKEAAKQEMFDAIPEVHRGGANNWDELKEKLESGELDNKTCRVYNNLCTYSWEFGAAAQDINKGKNPIMAVAHQEGAKGVETGGKLYVEVAKAAVGSALPGFKEGFEKAEKVIEKAEKVAKYVKDTYKKGLEGFKDSVKDAVEDKLGDVLEEKLGGNVADIVTFVAKKATGKEKIVDIIGEVTDPKEALEQATKYLGSLGLGTAKLVDSDEESIANVALARSDELGQLVVYVGDPEKDPFFLPEGEFDISVLDSEGNSDESTGVEITAGQATVVAVDTSKEDEELAPVEEEEPTPEDEELAPIEDEELASLEDEELAPIEDEELTSLEDEELAPIEEEEPALTGILFAEGRTWGICGNCDEVTKNYMQLTIDTSTGTVTGIVNWQGSDKVEGDIWVNMKNDVTLEGTYTKGEGGKPYTLTGTFEWTTLSRSGDMDTWYALPPSSGTWEAEMDSEGKITGILHVELEAGVAHLKFEATVQK